MSTVDHAIEPAPTPAPATPTHGTFRWLGRNAFALADQVLISAANFITMILTARSLEVSEFGDFTLVYSAILLANILQSTLITQPHNVLGSGMKGRDYRRYTSGTASAQLGLSMLQALVALGVWAIAVWFDWRLAPLLLMMPAAIVAWQLAEFVRRVLYTEGRLRAAFLNDCISYGGQMVVVAALWWNHSLTGASALLALAGTNALAAVVGAWQLRHSLARQIDGRAFAENWHFGKWLVGAEVLGYFASLHMYMYLAAIMLGTEATGEMRAAQILFGPMRVLSFFLATVLPIRFARTLAASGELAVHEQLKSVYRLVIPVAGIYCLLMVIGARPLLALVYSEDYVGGAKVLMLYAGCSFLQYMAMVVTAALTAKRLTRFIFGGYVFSAAVALSCSWIFIRAFGADGAILCMILTSALIFASFTRAYYKSLHQRGFSPVFATPEAT